MKSLRCNNIKLFLTLAFMVAISSRSVFTAEAEVENLLHWPGVSYILLDAAAQPITPQGIMGQSDFAYRDPDLRWLRDSKSTAVKTLWQKNTKKQMIIQVDFPQSVTVSAGEVIWLQPNSPAMRLDQVEIAAYIEKPASENNLTENFSTANVGTDNYNIFENICTIMTDVSTATKESTWHLYQNFATPVTSRRFRFVLTQLASPQAYMFAISELGLYGDPAQKTAFPAEEPYAAVTVLPPDLPSGLVNLVNLDNVSYSYRDENNREIKLSGNKQGELYDPDNVLLADNQSTAKSMVKTNWKGYSAKNLRVLFEFPVAATVNAVDIDWLFSDNPAMWIDQLTIYAGDSPTTIQIVATPKHGVDKAGYGPHLYPIRQLFNLPIRARYWRIDIEQYPHHDHRMFSLGDIKIYGTIAERQRLAAATNDTLLMTFVADAELNQPARSIFATDREVQLTLQLPQLNHDARLEWHLVDLSGDIFDNGEEIIVSTSRQKRFAYRHLPNGYYHLTASLVAESVDQRLAWCGQQQFIVAPPLFDHAKIDLAMQSAATINATPVSIPDPISDPAGGIRACLETTKSGQWSIIPSFVDNIADNVVQDEFFSQIALETSPASSASNQVIPTPFLAAYATLWRVLGNYSGQTPQSLTEWEDQGVSALKFSQGDNWVIVLYVNEQSNDKVADNSKIKAKADSKVKDNKTIKPQVHVIDQVKILLRPGDCTIRKINLFGAESSPQVIQHNRYSLTVSRWPQYVVGTKFGE